MFILHSHSGVFFKITTAHTREIFSVSLAVRSLSVLERYVEINDYKTTK